MKLVARSRLLLAAAALSITMTHAATAQNSQGVDVGEQLSDFIHYTLVAKPDLASAAAQMLLESGISNADLADLVDNLSSHDFSRLGRALDRGGRMADLEGLTARLAESIEAGRLDLARDPARIEEAIDMLLGPQRGRMLALERLKSAGEFAVGPLLKRISAENPSMALQCENVMREIGNDAVTPLCEALPHLDAGTQRRICDLLSDIGRPQAAPYLLDLAQQPNLDGSVEEAAMRTFRRLAPSSADLAGQYADLARQYFNGNASLVPHPDEETNNVWGYDQFVGLVPTSVPTEIFHEVMAMRLTGRALRSDPNNLDALTLFVASNLKRENELPAGEDDQIFGALQYSPAFFATVFGTEVCQNVLGLALDAGDTPLIRDAMAALAQTTGGSNLFSTTGGRQPLLEALTYPDRRVQYDAAKILGNALPETSFNGDYRVVSTLASAVRVGNQSFAVVVADSDEDRAEIVRRLGENGFTVVAEGRSLEMTQGQLIDAPSIDLAVVYMRDALQAGQIAAALQQSNQTTVTPVLLLTARADLNRLEREFRADQRVLVSTTYAPGSDADAFFADRVNDLLNVAVGGRMTEVEAEIYAIESLETLRDIAISRSSVYSIADAEPSLLDALASRTGGTRNMVAEILSMIESERAQRTLFDAALSAGEGEQVALLNHVASSIKRFGNRSERRHLEALLDVVANASGDAAEAGANVLGAMNEPRDAAVKLIPSEG